MTDDTGSLIGEYQQERQAEDDAERIGRKTEFTREMPRQAHSVLEASHVKGEPLYPHELVRDSVLTLYVTSILFFLAAFIPPPLHRAADPAAATAFPPPLPDWYLLWAFGCLKVAWDIEFTILGHHFFLMTAKVWGTLVQGMIIGMVVAVPFIDRALGYLIDPGPKEGMMDVLNSGHARRPIEDPVRAAIGVWGLAFVVMLSIYSINANIAIYYPVVTTAVLAQLTLWGPLACAGLTYLWHDRRRAEGARPQSDEERFDLYRNGITSRRTQRIYEFKLNRCYQCGLCDDICPVRTNEGEEELNIIFNTFQNEHDGVAMWSCITCGMCTAICPQNIEYVDYVLEQRAIALQGAAT